MAPEVVTRSGHNYGVDYYTLGALLHELVCGLPPFYSQDQNTMLNNILGQQLIIPNQVSSSLRDLLYKLLDKNIDERLCSFEEIKKHRWLKNVDWDLYARKQVPSPITIDLRNTYIH